METLRAEIKALEGKLEAKIDHLPSTWTIVGIVAAGVISALGLFIAFQGVLGDRASDAYSQATQNAQQTQQNREDIQKLQTSMDTIAAHMERENTDKSPVQKAAK